jgi:putative DNA primase/helicase
MSEFDAIPDELKEREQWLLWDSSAETPRRPHWTGDFGISWSDPADWHSFEEAVSAAQTRDSWGIGYVMAKDNDNYARGLYGCLDLDGVYDTDTESKEDWLPGLSTFFDEGHPVGPASTSHWSDRTNPSGGQIHISPPTSTKASNISPTSS